MFFATEFGDLVIVRPNVRSLSLLLV